MCKDRQKLKERSEQLSVWLESLEERVEAARREADLSAETHFEFSEVEDEDEDGVSLRRRIASAMFFLGAKLDPEAAAVTANKGEAV